MSLTVKYIDTPEGVEDNGKAESYYTQPFSSDVLKVVQSKPLATFEQSGWPLNGKMSIMDDHPKEIGIWSNAMSDNRGMFSQPPKIAITFPVAINSTMLTFWFGTYTNQWCSELRITWYSGINVVRNMTVHPDKSIWSLELLVEGYDRIFIEIVKTSEPYQFAKVTHVSVGNVITFDSSDVVSANVTSEADDRICELSVDTMSITVKDKKKRALAPQKNQKVELYQNDALVASQYIDKSTREPGFVYTFKCKSAIGLLDGTFLGGLYNNVFASSLLAQIMGDIIYDLAPEFYGTKVTGYIPVCTRREALQQLAFAIGAIVTTYGISGIRLEPPKENISSSIRNEDIFVGSKVETTSRYASVNVVSHEYSKSNEIEDLVSEEAVHGDSALITFSDPHYDYKITGGSIVDSDYNWVKVSANGRISISAKKFIHSTKLNVIRNSSALSSDQGNNLIVDSATLVNNQNVGNIVNRLFESSKLTSVLSEEIVVNGQHCGDKVSSINEWGTQTRGYIISMSSDYTRNGHTSAIKIRGVEIKSENAMYYSGELYSGDKEVIY